MSLSISKSKYGLIEAGAAAVAALVLSVTPAVAQTAGRQVTYSKDIAPILQRSCQRCHQPDSVAPMSLLTYQEVRPFARAIKLRTGLARAPYARDVMPPWFLEKNIGIQKIKDNISLSDDEIDAIAAWADAGAPQGDPADLPPPLPLAASGQWTLGKPDLIVSSQSIHVKAIAPDYGGLLGTVPTGLKEDRYVASAEWKERTDVKGAGSTVGGLFVFHHANARPIAPGQDGNEDEVGPRLPTHEVGRNGDVFPPENGRALKAGSTIRFDVHVHSPGSGPDRNAHLDLGLRLHPVGYKPKYESVEAHFGRSEIEINPNEDHQRIDAYWVAPENTKLINFEPHMHAAGVRMCLEAIYGKAVETISCAGYDHNWVRTYLFDDNAAPLLPKGTILHAIGWLDNTAKNKNITDPRNEATYGNSSVANMFQSRGDAIFLTDAQYQAELAKRREYLQLTGEDAIACPDCTVRKPSGDRRATR